MLMQVQDLIDIIFIKKLDVHIDLDLHQKVHNSTDLFYFCFDVLSKGIIASFGSSKPLAIDDLTYQQFDYIKSRILLLGIQVNLSIEENKNAIPPYIKANIDPIDILECHSMNLVSQFNIYHISFSLADIKK